MIKEAVRRYRKRTSVVSDAVSGEVWAAAFKTDLGWMALAHKDAALTGIVFGHVTRAQAVKALERSLARGAADFDRAEWLDVDEHPAAIADVVRRLENYACGEAVDFSDVVVDESHLTPFGRRIGRACRRIPAGQTRGYGELAAACSSPGAARAVGQVMARNRYPLVVPCHRVLAAGGLIGGFSAPQGLAMKRRLLELESGQRFN